MSTATQAPPSALTAHQLRALQMVADGATNAEIGAAFGADEDHAKNTVRAVLRKLDAQNRAHAVAVAFRAELIA